MAISEDFRILKWRIWLDMEVLHHIRQQFCQDLPSHGLDLDRPDAILTGSDGEMELSQGGFPSLNFLTCKEIGIV